MLKLTTRVEVIALMEIILVSLVERDGQVRAGARVTARQQWISVEVWFEVSANATRLELWLAARNEALRYFDPA